jgi:hypothetical protein
LTRAVRWNTAPIATMADLDELALDEHRLTDD